MGAADVARQMYAKFMADGNFVLAGPASAGFAGALRGAAPAAAGPVLEMFDDAGFANLAVQSVGHEQGVDDPKVHVYVIKGSKRSQREVTQGNNEIHVEIKRVGRVVVRPEAAAGAVGRGNVYVRHQRICCGSSCAPANENYAGTMGAIVKIGQKRFLLSNNHVLGGCNHTPVGTPIMAPSPIDASPAPHAPAPRMVARHALIKELRSGVPALVQPCEEDVALAEIGDPNLVSSRQGEGAESYDTPTQTAPFVSRMTVKKWGRTTGFTIGQAESLALPFAMPYKLKQLFAATVWFKDVWTIRATPGTPFALAGDSGAVVVNEDASRAIGLIFAATASGDFAWAVPMGHVLSCFAGAALVGGHHA